MNNLYITGMEGCGKTSVGKELARMAGIAFADVNEEVEREAGMSIAQILAKEGQEGLRKRAKEALQKISQGDWQIVSCNAEDPLDADSLSLMQDTGAVAFLDTPLHLLEKRFDDARRPNAITDKETLRGMFEARRAAYLFSCGVQIVYDHPNPVDAAYDLLTVFYPEYFWR